MDLSEVRKFDKAKVGTIKLSEAIRESGYGNHMDYNDCVLGRAYFRLTGRRLGDDGRQAKTMEGDISNYVRHAADTFGVPYSIAQESEWRCFGRETPEQIADWLESQGY